MQSFVLFIHTVFVSLNPGTLLLSAVLSVVSLLGGSLLNLSLLGGSLLNLSTINHYRLQTPSLILLLQFNFELHSNPI